MLLYVFISVFVEPTKLCVCVILQGGVAEEKGRSVFFLVGMKITLPR